MVVVELHLDRTATYVILHIQVGQMVHALKMGWMKPRGEIRKAKLTHDPNAPSLDLWKDDTEVFYRCKLYYNY